ncbi:cytochrome C biogenesis protein [archaeon]|nr:cytochrome C biogenesis protein [archaeon]
MVGVLANIGTSFVLGLLTPLTAVCVLPLFPGFIAYLSNKLTGEENNKKKLILLGLLVTGGVVLFMLLLGILFTTILQVSLTKVIGVISPIAFGVLFFVSLFLIFNVDIGKHIPKFRTSTKSDNPYFSALLYGFFFGAIVIPCNPLFIAALFTRTATTTGFFANIANFLSFGLGIGAPLLVFSIISSAKSQVIIGFLVKYKRTINLLAGLAMLIISIYYLVFVFEIFG